MIVYMIKFKDGSVYIGATKTTLNNRISNHKSKYKQGIYMHRKLYQKFEEFNCEFESKIIGKYSNINAMFKAEEMFIAFQDKSKILNNSTGGAYSSKGKKVTKETIEKQVQSALLNNEYFEIYCSKSGKLLYHGNNQSDASRIVGCTNSNISYGLNIYKKNFIRKKINTSKYIFKVVNGGGLFQSHLKVN